MQIKTFRAKSIQEALQLVREQLGPDACVHGTREVRGLIGRRLIEVQASGETAEFENAAEARSNDRSARLKTDGKHESKLNATADYEEASIASQLLDAELRSEGKGHTAQQVTTVDEVQPALLTQSEFTTAAAREICDELLQLGVDPSLANSLLARAVERCAPDYRNDAWLVRGQLNHLVAQQLKVSGVPEDQPHQQRMIAFVGPTGVGKTTLLGKIAARAYRESGLQIGIVTLDTWRGAAVEQLLQFAELVEAQVEVVGMIGQLAPALQRLREFDLVLIDTAGRSPNDSSQMNGLKELLQIAQPDETHLVLGCNASSTYAKNAMDRFQKVGATHLCISKLDEGGSLGQWLAPLWTSSISVMHLTHGQDVEKDLMVANVRHLASILLGQTSLVSAE